MRKLLKKISIVVVILGMTTGIYLTEDTEAAKNCKTPCIDFVW